MGIILNGRFDGRFAPSGLGGWALDGCSGGLMDVCFGGRILGERGFSEREI